jgi:hypothetical protein
LLAAYAFVLNALLATSLMAATSPALSLSGFELCRVAADDAGSLTDHDGKERVRAAVHCQICLQHAASASLPPPHAPAIQAVFGDHVACCALPVETHRGDIRTGCCSPRGPPSLI